MDFKMILSSKPTREVEFGQDGSFGPWGNFRRGAKLACSDGEKVAAPVNFDLFSKICRAVLPCFDRGKK